MALKQPTAISVWLSSGAQLVVELFQPTCHNLYVSHRNSGHKMENIQDGFGQNATKPWVMQGSLNGRAKGVRGNLQSLNFWILSFLSVFFYIGILDIVRHGAWFWWFCTNQYYANLWKVPQRLSTWSHWILGCKLKTTFTLRVPPHGV